MKQFEKLPIMKDEVTKEIIHSKSGILKQKKKPAKKPTDSQIKQPVQEPEIESTEQKNVDSSNILSSHNGITVNLFDKDTNVNIGEGVKINESSFISTTGTSSIKTSTIISYTIENSIVETSTTLPPITSPITTSILVSTTSPTYSTIMHELITTLFSTQSTEAGRMIHDEEPSDDEIMKQEERLAIHSKSFDYEIQKLRDISKERHELFVEQVTKMKESVDPKISELESMLSKEVQKMEQSYTLLHGKVDVIANAITKLDYFNSKYMNKLEAKSKKDA
ncbi:unnamed protein product [Lactuca saligna]|uniref:Uncharacterized protein n=1 Tax=Lactuca saligna TaxID=75948 RepID=A0AA35UZW5_LACSI|nr:unnamed protein product [Lactuca saligna]